jgi:RNA recognition motif-containing protein
MSKKEVTEQPMADSTSPEPVQKRKKKRKHEVPDEEKLEIDVNAPEPPSKKAKRLEKKKKERKEKEKKEKPVKEDAAIADSIPAQAKRSDHGIWMGNLPFSTTKEMVRTFLTEKGEISENDITRVHMPAPKEKSSHGRQAHNKGFAYIDFTSEEALDKALALSEKLIVGRAVLIKNAKSYEGRPEKAKGEDAAQAGAGAKGGKKNAPAKRIFVGNLDFDVTDETLREHFGQAGEIEDIKLATFEDTGKCKGFAWVTFREVEAAEAAVRGWVMRKVEEDEDEDSDAGSSGEAKKKKQRKNKKHINRLHGRDLRCEFAEDPATRYQKRFGKPKGSAANAEPVGARGAWGDRGEREDSGHGDRPHDPKRAAKASSWQKRVSKTGGKVPMYAKEQWKEKRREERRHRHEKMDARTVAPGKANASAPRASAAIVEAKGKKMVFED